LFLLDVEFNDNVRRLLVALALQFHVNALVKSVVISDDNQSINQSINLYFRHMAHKKRRRQTGNIYNRYTYIKPSPENAKKNAR